MPIGYLISVIGPAALVAATLLPAPRTWTLGLVCWRLGFQVNEVPMIVVAWLLAVTSLAAVQGDLSTPMGEAGLGVAGLTLAGLAIVVWRALLAGPASARALSQGLGPGWRADLASAAANRIQRRRPWLRLLFAPLAVRRHDVLRRANVTYGPAGKQNRLDLYLPRSGVATGPCLVYFHGGGYRSGRKNREGRALLYRLASQGWVCVSANYRLARSAPYPAALVDAKRAIAWMCEHAAAYGADPSAVVVAGSSAGAHLAAMAALTPNLPTLQPGFEQSDTRVSAAVCLYGFYGAPVWIERDIGAPSAPSDYVGQDTPPMLIVHGTHDSFVPVSGARQFAERVRAAGSRSPLVYLELPGAQHTFDLYHSVRVHAVMDTVDAFTATVLSGAAAGVV